MATTQKMMLRTSDLAEAIEAVSRVYCPHEVEIRESNSGVTAALDVMHGGAQAVVGLRYSTTVRAAVPRIVREAEHLMRTSGPQTSVSTIAAQVGVSLRSLEAGFREWRQCTPTQYVRKVRLEAARAELLAPSESTTVTAVALNNGLFHLARFSAYYNEQFDEAPGQTLRRSRLRR